MQELFWFFLGGVVYYVIDKTISIYKKVKFINDVKIFSYQLIGYAYEQLVFAMTAKYMMLETSSDFDKEKLKSFRNDDEAVFSNWKKEATLGLKNSLPVTYREALELENWDDIMGALDTHYKKALQKTYLKD
tara:strand:+ start:465 stop:860 length:396 start_codon:yes stop_codon:yes gene_type:complete